MPTVLMNPLVAPRQLAGAGLRRHTAMIGTSGATMGTSGNQDYYLMAPEDGVLDSIDYSNTNALAADDTNYITFTVMNLGQLGAGTTQMLAAVNGNTTKVTGGAALVANGRRALIVSTTLANLKVVAGDRLRFRAGITGTTAGSLINITIMFRFAPVSAF